MNAADPVAHALAYPFDLPDRGYVFARGRALFLKHWAGADSLIASADGPAPLRRLLSAAELSALGEPRAAVVACGSNGSPLRLAQKFGPEAVIPTLMIRLSGYAVVHSAKIAAYGSIPATLHPRAGAVARVFVNLLTEDQLAAMDATETLGVAYDRPALPRERAADLPGVETLYAYVSRHGALAAGGEPAALAAARQNAAGLRALSQLEAQQAAMRALGLGGTAADFIRQNLADANLRAARARALKDRAGAPFIIS
ncbi:MAG: hypothetical protein KIS81_08245 [Maricaulaceae bacterium]|nr:hypothetical protein [Maricaulaceae bacterium]